MNGNEATNIILFVFQRFGRIGDRHTDGLHGFGNQCKFNRKKSRNRKYIPALETDNLFPGFNSFR